MKYKHVLLCAILGYFACFQIIACAQVTEECDGIGITYSVWQQTDGVSGLKVITITPGCEGENLGLQPGQVILTLDGEAISLDNADQALAGALDLDTYSMKMLDTDGRLNEISHTRSSHAEIESIASAPDSPAHINPEQSQSSQEQADSKFTENAQLENPLTETENFKYEAPVYSKVEEVGNDWIIWIKWLIFFVIVSFTLTPILLNSATSQNAGIYLAAGAIVGAADSGNDNSVKGAVDGAKNAAIVYLLLLCMGPYGVFYCLYHPFLAFISEADKTYCCTMTWLGDDTVAHKAISADGHWLAEIKETSNYFLGLGDRELPGKYSLSVIDLTSGKHVKWPQTSRTLLSVDTNSQIQNIAIGEDIFIKIFSVVPDADVWYRIILGRDFLKPVNFDRVPIVKPRYSLLSTNGQQVQLQNISNDEIVTIQSDIAYKRSYLSYDGRVLALVYAHPEENEPPTDGVISSLISLADDAFLGRWEIEFWNVATGEKIATYAGYGFNKDAWVTDTHSMGRTDFLESSADGRFWYMCRSDGFIHVFDMSKHSPLKDMS